MLQFLRYVCNHSHCVTTDILKWNILLCVCCVAVTCIDFRNSFVANANAIANVCEFLVRCISVSFQYIRLVLSSHFHGRISLLALFFWFNVLRYCVRRWCRSVPHCFTHHQTQVVCSVCDFFFSSYSVNHYRQTDVSFANLHFFFLAIFLFLILLLLLLSFIFKILISQIRFPLVSLWKSYTLCKRPTWKGNYIKFESLRFKSKTWHIYIYDFFQFKFSCRPCEPILRLEKGDWPHAQPRFFFLSSW